MGILSILLCCIYGGLLGIPGLILGILSCVCSGKKYKMAIGGIITSILGLLLFGLIVIGLLLDEMGVTSFRQDIWNSLYGQIFMWQHPDWLVRDIEEDIDLEEEIDQEEYIDLFAGHIFDMRSNSAIYFGEDGDFVWYEDDEDHTDNYRQGTYTTCRGERAREVLVDDLPEGGVTEEDLHTYFTFYGRNLTALILQIEQVVSDGEDQQVEPYEQSYIGGFPVTSEVYSRYDAVCTEDKKSETFLQRWEGIEMTQ